MSTISNIRTILDESGNGTFWTPPQVYDDTNAGLLHLWGMSRHHKISTSMTTSTGESILAIPVAAIMIPQYITFDDQEYWITTVADLERHSQNWRSAPSGPPQAWVLWDWKHLRVWPTSNADYPFLLHGVPWPDEMGSSHETISGEDETFLRAVEYESAAMLLDPIQPQFADLYRVEGEDHRKQFIRKMRNRHSQRLMRFQPSGGGEGFSVGHSGNASWIRGRNN